VVFTLGGGADHPERCQPLLVVDQKGDWWKTGLYREYPSWCGGKAICGPSLDLVPKGIEASLSAHAGCEQVGAVEQDRGYQGCRQSMA